MHTYESLSEFAPDWIATPGDTIADLLEERGWTQADFATRTGFTKEYVHLLLQGKATIFEDIALRLERVLGGSARYWMNLESQYRARLLAFEAGYNEDEFKRMVEKGTRAWANVPDSAAWVENLRAGTV